MWQKKQVDALGGSWIAFFLTFECLFCGDLHTKDVNSGGWYVKKVAKERKVSQMGSRMTKLGRFLLSLSVFWLFFYILKHCFGKIGM